MTITHERTCLSSARTQRLVNARAILPNDVITTSIEIIGDRIGSIGSGGARDISDVDCEGDYILPGIVDLHTDNLESHYFPRPGVTWPNPEAAFIAHDRQMATAGVTTSFDALSMATVSMNRRQVFDFAQAALNGPLQNELWCEHFIHLRCELPESSVPSTLRSTMPNKHIKLISAMDHTPGQRQWRDLTVYRNYRGIKKGIFWTDTEFANHVSASQLKQGTNIPIGWQTVSEVANEFGVALASHDDTTTADVEHGMRLGVSICEFPTTIEAAARAENLGLTVVMGAPNIVLGGSHAGNIGALVLAERGLLDVLTSDYVPGSMLLAAFELANRGFTLSQAIAMMTANPAEAVGLADRGRISTGLRADLVRVCLVGGMPTIRGVWVKGRRYI